MTRRWRLFAGLAVAVLVAPGTWLRTDLSTEPPRAVAVARVQGEGPMAAPGWRVAGVWHYRASNLQFGGYSALLALADNRLVAFSDRGTRWMLTQPDRPGTGGELPAIALQPMSRADADDVRDIESATRDPATGEYWLGYENRHAIRRFTAAHGLAGKRDLRGLVDWGANAGAEALVRLTDGRFVVLPEGEATGLIFPFDPVAGAPPSRFTFQNPAPGFSATDAVQLPDGRLLVLMRDVAWGYPPFSSVLAIGPAPCAGGVFAPVLATALDPVIPRENYEGIAIRPRTDGRIDVWLISDDNLSVMQRTLLVKLIFDPR